MAIINLTDGVDDYTATGSGDSIFAKGGNDILRGNANNNGLVGDAGDDTIFGGAGAETIYGEGINNVVSPTARNRLEGGGGNDTIWSGAWFDTVIAGDGADTVYALAIRTGQSFDGGSGDDLIDLSALTGAQAPIFVDGDAVAFSPIIGGVNTATITGFERYVLWGAGRADTLIGGPGNDTILASGNADPAAGGMVDGKGGDDLIGIRGRAAAGVQNIDGGPGFDTLTWTTTLADRGQTGPLVLDMATGDFRYNNNLIGRLLNFEKLVAQPANFDAGPVTIIATGGDDTINAGNMTAVRLEGGGGNDTLQAYNVAGPIVIDGGGGDDIVNASFGVAGSTFALSGGAGQDLLNVGGNGAFSALNASGFESIHSIGQLSITRAELALFSKVESPLQVGGGAFVIIDPGLVDMTGKVPALGRFVMPAGGGTFIAEATSGTIVTATGAGAITFYGKSGNTTVTGGTGADVIVGGAANDSLTAGGATSGYDILFGGTGNDTIRKGAAGAFYVLGEGGNDTVDAGAGPADVTVYDYVFLGDGNDTLTKPGSGQLYVEGGAGNDRITGGAQTLPGGAATEYLFGDGGADTINGGAGNDVLVGANYKPDDPDPGLDPVDSLSGGDGDDYVLQGSWGRAIMAGDAGADTIVGAAKSDTLRGGAGDDFLFGGGGGDFFDFHAADLVAGGTDTVYDFYSAGQTIRFTGVAASAVSYSAVGTDFVGLSVAVSGGTHTILAGTFGLTSLAQVQAQTTFL